jgi:hypothetical protein
MQREVRLQSDTRCGGAQGISNAKGFYKYSKAGAKQWERAWVNFTYDVAALVRKYERRVKF